MKNCIVILGSKDPIGVNFLLNVLKDIPVYVHIDNKSDISKFNIPKDKLIETRTSVLWGEFSMWECMLNSVIYLESDLMKSYDSYTFISEADLPLHNSNELNKLISEYTENGKLSLLDCDPSYLKDSNKQRADAIIPYGIRNDIPGNIDSLNTTNKYDYFELNKEIKFSNCICSQWCTWSKTFVKKLLSELTYLRKEINAFRNTLISDEIASKYLHQLLKVDYFPSNYRLISWDDEKDYHPHLYNNE